MWLYNIGNLFERIAIDIVGPFQETYRMNKYILAAVDYFSKWVKAYNLLNQEVATVAEAFVKNRICHIGDPLDLNFHQDRNFEPVLFRVSDV